jgi:hypothetical protein
MPDINASAIESIELNKITYKTRDIEPEPEPPFPPPVNK